MLTLYTAIGRLKTYTETDGTTVAAVINGPHEYHLCKEELLLWSCLAFQILQIHELEHAYTLRLPKEANNGLPFPHYLNRLILRGLIVKGDGLTGADALYRLLGELQIRPVETTFTMRLLSCIALWQAGKIRLLDFPRYLKKEQHTQIEQTVLDLARTATLTTAELVTCVDQGIQLETEKDIYRLYQDADTTYHSLADEAQLHHTQYPILQAVGNLYLNKQISFQQI